jgi:hypothetical protein
LAPHPSGNSATQLVLDFRVTNLTNGPLLLSDIALVRPRTFDRLVVKTLATYSALLETFSPDNFVERHSTAPATSTFLIERDIGKPGKSLKVIADLIDQRGNRTRLKYRKLQNR